MAVVAQARPAPCRDSREQIVRPFRSSRLSEPMPTRCRPLVALGASLLLLVRPAAAQSAAPVSASNGEHVDSASGARRAVLALSESEMVIKLAVRSDSALPPGRFVILDSVAPHHRLVGSSAVGEREDVSVGYSVDGGRAWASSPMEETMVQGVRQRRLVAPERIRHLRFTIAGAVRAGEVVRVEYRVRRMAAVADGIPGT
jgi:hypothetical protein